MFSASFHFNHLETSHGMNLIFIKFFYVLGLYPPHEIILKISNNLSMNLKKIINNIDFIIKNE